MARKRASKKRVDYRAGGRVRAGYGAFLGDQQGGESTESDAGNRDTVTGKFDSEGPVPDPPGTIESGDFTYTSENDQRNFWEKSRDTAGDLIGRAADIVNPFDKSHPIAEKIQHKGQQAVGSDPGVAYDIGYSTQEGVAAADAGSGYDQTGYAGETQAGSSEQSEIPPKPNVDDYPDYDTWRLAVAEWETRYGEGEKSNEGVKADRDEELFESVTQGSGSSSSSESFETGTQTGNTTMALDQDARAKRIAKTTQQIQDQYSGNLPAGSKIEDISTAGGTSVDPAIAAETKQLTGDYAAQQRQAGVTRVADVNKVTDVSQAEDPTQVTAKTYDAATAGRLDPTTAAQGSVSRIAEAEGPSLTERATAATRDTGAEEAALADTTDFKISSDAFVDKVTGKVATVTNAQDAKAFTRQAITMNPADPGKAAQIENIYGFGAAKRRAVKGNKARKEAKDNLTLETGVPENVADALVEDPNTIAEAMESQDAPVIAAIADLPQEALVSSQMESLLAGMEEGETPAWARPAVAAIEQQMAERGLDVSTVGRDALFNAIIQSAFPIAQSNAQALQARAAQNLTNEQQAIRQERQIASTFLQQNASFRQQMNLANLNNDQQMRLANLTALNQAASESLSNEQQTELANLNKKMQVNSLQANIAAQMNQAQLNVDQQRAVQNAAMVANVDMSKFNADQQVQLANSKFMQTATLADLNNRQQTNLQNATLMAQMDLAAADQRTKLAITNAQNFLQMDMANLSNEQQAIMFDQQANQQRLLSDQAATNAARQFNATSENQTNQFMSQLSASIDQFNVSQNNSMKQFNAQQENAKKAQDANIEADRQKFNAQMASSIDQFNQQVTFQRDSWNAQNAQAVEQANVQWRRQASTINTAAQNKINAQNAMNAFNMNQRAMSFLWQELRDQADYDFKSRENELQRKASLAMAALGNDSAAYEGNEDWTTRLQGALGIAGRFMGNKVTDTT